MATEDREQEEQEQQGPPPAPATVDTSQGHVRIRVVAKSRVFPIRADGTVDRRGMYWTFKHTHERDAYPHRRGYATLQNTASQGIIWVQVDDDDAKRVRLRKPGERACYYADSGCKRAARRGSYFCSEKHAADWGEWSVRKEAMLRSNSEEGEDGYDEDAANETAWCVEHERYITYTVSHQEAWPDHHLIGRDNKPWHPKPKEVKSEDEDGGEEEGSDDE